VGRRLQPERIGLLLAARSPLAEAGLSVTLERSPVGDRMRRVHLGPLSLGALRAIVHSHTGVAPTRPLLSRLHEISRGNPFFAIELARALPHHLAIAPELRIPASLHAVVQARLARLPPDELEVLTVAAALSQPTLDLVGRALGREPRVSEAIAAGIIEAPVDPIRFTHPLLASAVSSRATSDERRALHLRLASVVRDEEQAARHLARAAAGPDADAAAVLERAAAAVRARGTADAAAGLADHALQMTPPGDRADLHRRRLAAAAYHFDAGASEQASALLTEVLSVATPGRERAEALLELGILKIELDRLDDAAQMIEDALGECGDDALAATAHLNLAWIYAELSGLDQAAPHAWAAVRGAERLQDPALLAQALASTVYAGLLTGRTDAAPALTRAIALERDLSVNIPLERRPSYVEAIRLTLHGEFDAATERLERLVQLGRDTADAAIIGPLTVLTALNEAAGRLDAALRGAVEAADIAEQVGRETPRAGCLSLLARVEAIVGRLGDARGHGEQALALAERSGHPFYIAMARTALAFIELSAGDLGAATRWLDPALPLMAELALRGFVAAERVMRELICVLAGAGRADEAGLLAERLQAKVGAKTLPVVHAIVGHCDGVVRAARGDLDGALIALERALENHEAAAAVPFDHGLTLLELGRVQRRLRRKRDSRATLERALAVFEALGAPLWAETARTEIGRIGGRTAADGLTASEQRIASLVAEGRSNREVAAELCVTVRTVETALTRIYRKLDVRSRAELAHKFAEVAGAKT
jgi:DNA-binding CsgD family transcriptional regulator